MNLNERESSLRLVIQKHQEYLLATLVRLQGRDPMLRGSIYTRRRRCGKPRCRCLRGRLHKDRVLAVRDGGRLSVRGLDPVEDAEVEAAVAAWQGFRRQRSELSSACRSLLGTVDRLAGLRLARTLARQ